MRLPSAEKLFSCGWSPESKEPVILPVAVSIACTLRAVDADTSMVLPSGEIAAWSARLPSTGVRHAIFPVATSIATTSAKLGRET